MTTGFYLCISGVLNPLASTTHLRSHCLPHHPPHSTATPYGLLYTLLSTISTFYNLHSTHTSLHYPTAGFVFSFLLLLLGSRLPPCWEPLVYTDKVILIFLDERSDWKKNAILPIWKIFFATSGLDTEFSRLNGTSSKSILFHSRYIIKSIFVGEKPLGGSTITYYHHCRSYGQHHACWW